MVQSNDYDPAKRDKKDQDITTLQRLIAKFQEQINQLSNANSNTNLQNNSGISDKSGKRKYFKYGNKDHVIKDCPKKNDTQDNNNSNGNNNNKRSLITE